MPCLRIAAGAGFERQQRIKRRTGALCFIGSETGKEPLWTEIK